ncbi:MAG: fibronectin type III domain-containing protein [Paludibacteraceae bacterium]|nr:fibronectin type III domain-containing protein [Paludibacteraceae bacterium]
MKRYISSVAFLVAILFGVYNSVFADELTVAPGTTNTNSYVPIRVDRTNSVQKTQTIYDKTKISVLSAMGCNITGIRYYANDVINYGSGTYAFTVPTYSVSLAEVDDEVLTGFLPNTIFTEVYTGKPTKGTSELFFDFSSNPFYYSGAKNLIVQVRITEGGGWSSSSIKFYSTGQGKNVSYYQNHSQTYGTDAEGAVGSMPKTTFTYQLVTATCPDPTNLTLSESTPHGASFTWTAGGSETQWQYICLPAADAVDWTDAAVQTTSSASATVSDLMPGTQYKFYVRAYCAADDQSQDVSLQFTTPCGAILTEDLPYTYGFAGDASGAIPACWGRKPYVGSTTVYPSVNTGYQKDDANCLYFFGGYEGTESTIILPEFEEPTNNLKISFWYYNGQTTSSYPQLKVGYMTDTTDISTFHSLSNLTRKINWTHTGDIELTAAPANSYIAIQFSGGSSSSTAYVDNIIVSPIISCVLPTNLSATNITATGATVSWTHQGNATYSLRYKVQGAENWITIPDALSTTTYTLSGLDFYVTYDFQVGVDCGGTINYSSSASFTTSCGFRTLPFSEDFDDLSAGIPVCWDNTEGNVAFEGYRFNYYASGHNATKCVSFNSYDTPLGQHGFLKTPEIYICCEAQLRFWYRNAQGGDFSVYYSIGNGSKVELATGLVNQSAWKQEVIDLPQECIGQNIRICFKGTSNNATGDAYINLDEVQIVAPPCNKPTSISITPTGDGGIVSWTDPGSSSWSLRYRTTMPQGEWTTIDNLTSPTYTITGLTIGTQYDVQVQSHCSIISASDWSATKPLIPVCEAPVGITVTNIGESTATVNFPEQADYWYRCVPQGETPNWSNTSTGRVFSESTKLLTYQNSGLTVCTDYDLYVRKVCDNEHYSEPTMVSFTTTCEDFIFLDTEGDGLWKNAGNWSSLRVPSIRNNAIIRRPATIDAGTKGEAKSVLIDQTTDDPAIYNGQIIIQPQGELIVATTLKKQTGENASPLISTAVASDLQIQTSALGNGVLAIGEHNAETGLNSASVSFYTKACKTENEGWINQYIGTPFSSLNDVYVDYYGSYIYKFDPTMPEPVGEENDPRWVNVKRGTGTVSFWGYNLLRRTETPTTLALEGTLCPSENKVLSMYYNGVSQTENVFANSWMAPIDITSMDEGFVNAEKTIYIFNAGSKRQALDFLDGASQTELPTLGTGDNTSPGQYIAMPVNSARWVASPELTVIPPMQAFSVFATDESASLTLDYEQMVFEPLKSMEITTATTPLRAPRQEENKPDILKITVADKDGNTDKLYLLVREDFTSDFDNGYDGRKMFGDPSNPQLYALTDAGMMSIVCDNKAEGTLIGFRPNESDTYTISFDYDGSETLYLNDMVSNISTLINNQNEYIFSPAESDLPVRFVISQKTENEALTGIDQNAFNNMPSGEVRKVLINGVLYIIKGKNVYHITGVRVK